MTELERTGTRDARVRDDTGPRLAGRRVTDVSAVVGCATWLVLVGGSRGGPIDLSVVALYVAFAMLVLVALGLGLVARGHSSGSPPLYTVAVLGQYPAGLAAVGALASPQGSPGAVALAVPWLAVAGAMALYGFRRLLARGIWPLPELAVDVAHLYVSVAAVFLLAHVAGLDLGFAPIIVLLTAVHFHYAGFVLSLVVGLVGRLLAVDDGEFESNATGRVATATTVVILGGIVAIAVGITFSPLVEALAVGVFTTGVLGFAVLVLRDVVPALPRLPGVLLAIAWLSLFWTMALALAFAYGSLPGTTVFVTIPEMIRWHGSVNAFGFALPALLAFRLLDE